MVTTNYQVGSLDFAPYSNSTFLDDFYTDDVYSFSVGQPTYVELDLYNITFGDDADLYLYQDDGDFLFESNQDFFIESSRLAGNANDSISEFLGSGNYFAQVERYAPGSSGSLDYTIDISSGSTGGLSLFDIGASISSGFAASGGSFPF